MQSTTIPAKDQTIVVVVVVANVKEICRQPEKKAMENLATNIIHLRLLLYQDKD